MLDFFVFRQNYRSKIDDFGQNQPKLQDLVNSVITRYNLVISVGKEIILELIFAI